ncbi:MAG: hypothetical protein KDD15_32700, partial [Lewinella sp.]|nr:hypothetical protein [Lewinella sp.]
MLGLALILIIGPGKTTAQDKVYVFNRLNTDNDLTSGQYNYYVYQDSYGLVWISSTKGLNRFDGTSVKQFHANPDDPCSLLTQNGAQSRFQEDRRGDLWFAADIGLTHYLRTQDRFEHHYLIAPGEDTLRDYYFWAYLDTLANQMFVSGGRQLFSIDLNASKLDLHNRIDTIYVGLKDRMIPAPQGGYYLFRHGRSRDVLEVRHYNSNALMRPPTRYRLPGNARLNDTKYINDTLVWVATSNGLYQLNLRDSGWTTIPGTYRGKKIDGITELVMRKNGQILVATYDQGIYYFDPLSKRYTGRMLSFQQERIEHFSPIIDRVTLDRKENLWISTKDNGIYYTHLDKPKFGIDLAG